MGACMQVYSEFHCVVMIRRYSRWYLWNVFSVVAGLITIAWYVCAGEGGGGGLKHKKKHRERKGKGGEATISQTLIQTPINRSILALPPVDAIHGYHRTADDLPTISGLGLGGGLDVGLQAARTFEYFAQRHYGCVRLFLRACE